MQRTATHCNAVETQDTPCLTSIDVIPDPDPDPDQENIGGERARAIVDLICDRWPNWTREQAEASYLRLRGGHASVPVAAWPGIVRAAHTAAPPDLGTHRIHTWIHRQAEIWERGGAQSPRERQYVPSPVRRDTSTEPPADPMPMSEAVRDPDLSAMLARIRGRAVAHDDEEERDRAQGAAEKTQRGGGSCT